jgi:hypothetical protein
MWRLFGALTSPRSDGSAHFDQMSTGNDGNEIGVASHCKLPPWRMLQWNSCRTRSNQNDIVLAAAATSTCGND